MDAGVLRIEHAEFGVELFAVGAARCNVFQREDGRWELVIAFRTTAVISRSDGWGVRNDALPNVEASAIVAEAPVLESGTVIVQEQGYDYETDENLSVLYYFEHESIEKLRVTVHGAEPGWIDAEVSGVAVVNGSNGRDPDAAFTVRTKFVRDGELYRSFS